MFGTFKEWYENRHDYARDLKRRTDCKVMGYFCTYTPEEILYAFDIVPVRILGAHDPQSFGVASPYIFGMYCPFCRDVLAQAVLKKYDYLDGIFIGQSCIHVRQSFWSWEHHFNPGFSYYLPAPMNVVDKSTSLPFFVKELEKCIAALEDWTGKKITDSDLQRGIEIVNNDRKLMKKVYEYRKMDNPKVTGLESLYLVVSSQMTDKREHASEIEKILPSLEERTMDRECGVRLMTTGSENDDVEFLKLIENESVIPATVVVEDHCTGTRYFWDEVEPEDDPVLSIAKRYLKRTPCPSRDWAPERYRFKRILEFAKDYNVQGAIVVQQKFCDPHEIDIPALKKFLEDNGVKTYFLELDITVPKGQFKIRLEAFLETFTAESLFEDLDEELL